MSIRYYQYMDAISKFNESGKNISGFDEKYIFRYGSFRYDGCLIIKARRSVNSSYEDEIIFTKNKNDLFLYSSEVRYNDELVLKNLGPHVVDFFDLMEQFYEFGQQKTSFNSINSNLTIFMDKDSIGICKGSDGTYKFETDSYSILTTLADHESELFDKIYLNIQNCPEWCRNDLFNYRKEKLEAEEKKIQKAIEKAASDGYQKRKSIFNLFGF